MPEKPSITYQERIEQQIEDAETRLDDKAITRVRAVGGALCKIYETSERYIEVRTSSSDNIDHHISVHTSLDKHEVFSHPLAISETKEIISTGSKTNAFIKMAKFALRNSENVDEAETMFRLFTEDKSTITPAVYSIPLGEQNEQELTRDKLLTIVSNLEEEKKQKASLSLTRHLRHESLPRRKEFTLSLMSQMEDLGILHYGDLFNPETLMRHPGVAAIIAKATKDPAKEGILLKKIDNPTSFAQRLCLKLLQKQESQEKIKGKKVIISGILELFKQQKNPNRQDFSWHTLINTANEFNSSRNKRLPKEKRLPNLDISNIEASDPTKIKELIPEAFRRLTAWLPSNDEEGKYVKDINDIFNFLVKKS